MAGAAVLLRRLPLPPLHSQPLHSSRTSVAPLRAWWLCLSSLAVMSDFGEVVNAASQRNTVLPRTPSLQKVGNYPLHFEADGLRPSSPVLELRGGAAAEAGSTDEVLDGSGGGGGKARSTVGICFDIDGVFKHGGKWEQRGAEVIRRVIDADVPFVFMTNGGGGRTEAEYISDLQTKLLAAEAEAGSQAEGAARPLDLSTEQMILSYSPWNTDLAHYKDKPILVVGDPKARVMNVAAHYGFSRAIHITDYDDAHPLMDPFKKEDVAVQTEGEQWDEDIKAICVFTDPGNFFQALQIVIDCLLSSRPGTVEFEEEFNIPIFFSNPDLLWKTQYPFGRFGQGAFRLALESLYVARLGSLGASPEVVTRKLDNWVQYGKPELTQYDFVLRKLAAQMKAHGGPRREVSHFYMIGDNPHSDMQGCVNMNERLRANRNLPEDVPACDLQGGWSGLLVRTGVFSDGDDTNQAAAVVDDVWDAVELILKENRLTPDRDQDRPTTL